MSIPLVLLIRISGFMPVVWVTTPENLPCEDAAEYAHDNAIDCLAVDDMEGYMVWQRVLNVLDAGILIQPPASQRVH